MSSAKQRRENLLVVETPEETRAIVYRVVNGKLKIQSSKKLDNVSVANYRLAKLLVQYQGAGKKTISTEDIIDFYTKNIMRYLDKYEIVENGKEILRAYTPKEIKFYALTWFDRNLGNLIRNKVLGKEMSIELVLSRILLNKEIPSSFDSTVVLKGVKTTVTKYS